MIQRKTQDLAYWRDEYQISEEDHEFIYERLAEADEPQHVTGVAQALIARRGQVEESRIRNELSRGLVYDPKEAYAAGDEVVFPAYDFRLAEVIDVRRGDNPEIGEFGVIQVRFLDNADERMFAAELPVPHTLNRNGDAALFANDDLLTPEEIYASVQHDLVPRVQKHLEENSDLFVSAGSLWFTTDQMVQVGLGHLNIAEAAIEMSGASVSTARLLESIDFDGDVPETVRIFSLETALYHDERFVQVGSGEKVSWFLRRMMPPEAIAIPDVLRYEPVNYDRSLLDVELLQMEWELGDEMTDGGLAEEAPPVVPAASTVLIYPHLASGTLPLTSAIQHIFPEGDEGITGITLIDGRWGSRSPGWVVHQGRFVAGLSDWFKQHKLTVGARISVERTKNPMEFVVDFKPQRTKREWVRTAIVGDDGLTFDMQRHQLSFDYDDNILILVPDPDAIAMYGATLRANKAGIAQLARQIMPELTKLSPQGTAHAKTLYSAINLVRRMPPGPVFAALAQLSGAVDTGSGYWSM